jgi:hypothetical protein
LRVAPDAVRPALPSASAKTLVKAIDIIRGNIVLRSGYALWTYDTSRSALSEETTEYFLLWMAIYGRHKYHGIIIDEDFFNFITQPAPPYLSKLELFVAINSGKEVKAGAPRDIFALHQWYYADAVLSHDIGIYVTSEESGALARMTAATGAADENLSLLDQIVHATNQSAESTYDLSKRQDRLDYKEWLSREGADALPAWLPPPSSEGGVRPRRLGVNLIGFAGGVFGIGEDLRAFARVARRAGAPFGIYSVALPDQHATNMPSGLDRLFIDRPIFPVNLLCMPLSETERLRLERGPAVFSGRYNIANWAWELSTLPQYWRHAFDRVDEVWAMSQFLVDVYQRLTSKPVVYMPPYVNVERIDPVDLGQFGFHEGNFVFLTMLDFNSHLLRKNPIGTIQAFTAAFPSKNGKERLLIKTINGHARPEKLDELLKAVCGDSRIVVVDGAYPRATTNGLIATVDCFVSLHRSEGFGRVIAEAMIIGTPVIATAYSGSNDFLDETTGYPVSYRLVPVAPGEYPFMEGSDWAEPELDDAVEKFRIVVSRRAEVRMKANRGQSEIGRRHGLEPAHAKFVNRMGTLGVTLAPPKR